MKNLKKYVLIRGHQSLARESMFGGRCVTILTSKYYKRRRVVAVADFRKKLSVLKT